MRLSKKDIERHYFERFKALLAEFPDGLVIPTEEPDFLVVGKCRTIGIELTELHRETLPGAIPQQAKEAMQHRVVAHAQNLYVSTGLPPVRCSVFMNDGHIRKGEVENLAAQILDIVIRNLPGQNASASEQYAWTNRSYFPELLHSVTVHRLDAITETHFTCPGATWVAPLASDDIRRSLLSKEGKYSAYRQRCDEAWLLINTDIGQMSTWFQFDSTTLPSAFTTKFERAFVLRHFSNELHELSVEPPVDT